MMMAAGSEEQQRQQDTDHDVGPPPPPPQSPLRRPLGQLQESHRSPPGGGHRASDTGAISSAGAGTGTGTGGSGGGSGRSSGNADIKQSSPARPSALAAAAAAAGTADSKNNNSTGTDMADEQQRTDEGRDGAQHLLPPPPLKGPELLIGGSVQNQGGGEGEREDQVDDLVAAAGVQLPPEVPLSPVRQYTRHTSSSANISDTASSSSSSNSNNNNNNSDNQEDRREKRSHDDNNFHHHHGDANSHDQEDGDAVGGEDDDSGSSGSISSVGSSNAVAATPPPPPLPPPPLTANECDYDYGSGRINNSTRSTTGTTTTSSSSGGGGRMAMMVMPGGRRKGALFDKENGPALADDAAAAAAAAASAAADSSFFSPLAPMSSAGGGGGGGGMLANAGGGGSLSPTTTCAVVVRDDGGGCGGGGCGTYSGSVGGTNSVGSSTQDTINSRTQLLPPPPSDAPTTPITNRRRGGGGPSPPPLPLAAAEDGHLIGAGGGDRGGGGGGGKKKKIKRSVQFGSSGSNSNAAAINSVSNTTNRAAAASLSPAATTRAAAAAAAASAAAGGNVGSSGGILNRLGAKLGRKRPSSSSASAPGASTGVAGVGTGSGMDLDGNGKSSSGDRHLPSPSTPVRGENSNDCFTLKPRSGNGGVGVDDRGDMDKPSNSGLPNVNSFPLGADGKGGGGGTLRRLTSKAAARAAPASRKLNLGGLASSSSSSMTKNATQLHEQAGLLDSDGKPMDTSLDMDDDSGGVGLLGGIGGGSSPGYDGDFRASPPRHDGIGTHSSLEAAAVAAAAATCPLTPTESQLSRNSLPPAALLNTPPASSPSPLFVSAKKIGSEIRQRHGAKRRKGSSRRTKKARRSLRAAQKKAAEDAAAAAGGAVVASTVGTGGPACGGSGAPRRLSSSPPNRPCSSKPVSVDDSFSSNESAGGGAKDAADEIAEGDVSKSMQEMGLNTPTSGTESAQAVHNARRNDSEGIGPRDLAIDIPSVHRDTSGLSDDGSFPSLGSQRPGAFPLVLQSPPPSPSSSLSGSDDERREARKAAVTRRAEDFDAGPWLTSHDRMLSGSSDSESESDSYSDDSTVCRGYPPLPRPPENATEEEKSRFYWEQLYGIPPTGVPPVPPPSRPPPHILGGLGASSGSLHPDQQQQQQPPPQYLQQGSWSASRAPPSKSCLSSKTNPSSLRPRMSAMTGLTAVGADNTNFVFASPAIGAAASVMATTPGSDINDGLCTPKKGSPSFSEHDPSDDKKSDKNEGDKQKPNLHIRFGSSRAAVFDTTRPTIEISVLPDEVAGEQFPVEYVEETEEEVVHHKETVDNSAMLAEWENDFDSFLDEDDSDQQDGKEGNTGKSARSASSSPMDCDDIESACSDTSGCFADDDMTPLSRPKRPRKKKRRKSKHRYTGSAEKDDRRQSSLFFSPGGGSLLGSDDEDDTCDEATPMRDVTGGDDDVLMENLVAPSYSPEEAVPDADKSQPGSLYISPLSLEGARSSLEGALTQNAHLDSTNTSTAGGAAAPDDSSPNASKELFRSDNSDPVAHETYALAVNMDDDVEINEASAVSLLFKRAAKAQAIDALDRPMSSFAQGASESIGKESVTEFLLRKNTAGVGGNNTHADLVGSISQANPLILGSMPPKIAAEVRDGVSPDMRLAGVSSDNATTIIDDDTTVADFCSQLARAALYEWRSREVQVMWEAAASSFQALAESRDADAAMLETLSTEIDNALTSARTRAGKNDGTTQQGRDSRKIVQEINSLESQVDRESRKLEISLKKQRLSEVQLHLERQAPTPEIAHQMLSTVMPIRIKNISEDVLETTFQNSDGSCTQLQWNLQCGSSSGEYPEPSSPTAIEGFNVSSFTSPSDVDVVREKQSPTLKAFQKALLRGFLQLGPGTDAYLYHSALDRFITHQANLQTSFPAAFTATTDLLNRMKLFDLDVAEVLGRSCSLDVQITDDSSMVGLLLKITLVDGSSLGVLLMYEEFDGRSPVKLFPMDVSVVALGSDAASTSDESLLKKLADVVKSILRRRQGCNAFLLQEICQRVTEGVITNSSSHIEV